MMHCPTPISCSLREDVSLVALRIKDGERLMHDVPTPKAFNWLHKVHLLIDGLCEKHRLSKLSSEGCFVLLGAGVDSEDADHAASALRFACALLKEAREVSLPHTMEKLQLQVALHCGAVTSAILGFKMLKLQTYGPAVVAVQDVVAQAPGNTIVASDTFLLRLRSASSWQLFRSLDVHGRTSQSLFILQPSPSVAAAPLPEDKCSPSPSPCQPVWAAGYHHSCRRAVDVAAADELASTAPQADARWMGGTASGSGHPSTSKQRLLGCAQRPSTWKTEGEEPEAAPREAKTRPVGSTCSQDSAALCGLDQGLMARWGLDLRFADSTDERRFQLQRAAKMFAPDVAYMALTSGLQLYVLWTMNYLASVFGCVMMVLAVWPLLVALATPRAFQKHRTAILVVGRIVRCSFWFLNVLTNSAAMLGQSSQALVMRTTLSSGLVWCLMHALGTSLPFHVHLPVQAAVMVFAILVDHAHCAWTNAAPALAECQPVSYPLMIVLHTLLLFVLPTVAIWAYEVCARLAFLAPSGTKRAPSANGGSLWSGSDWSGSASSLRGE